MPMRKEWLSGTDVGGDPLSGVFCSAHPVMRTRVMTNAAASGFFMSALSPAL